MATSSEEAGRPGPDLEGLQRPYRPWLSVRLETAAELPRLKRRLRRTQCIIEGGSVGTHARAHADIVFISLSRFWS